MDLLKLILASAGEGIYGLDGDGRTTFVNPAACRLLGFCAEELIGEPMHAVLHHTRSDGSPYAREECPIYAAIKDGKVHRVENEVFWRRDGTSFPVEYTSTPIREHGRLVGAVVVFWDITARKLAEDQLKAALRQVEELTDRLQKENLYLQEEIKTEHNFEEIVGQSPEMLAVLQQVEIVAPTDANVLVSGETGTGKELVARAIHHLSPRREKALIKVNCASVPTELFESEFFGHVKGAFTGALRDRAGRFGLADRGTLFLDEVGEITLDMQSKLLRVLQEGQYERIGEETTREVDVRVIAATNQNLEADVDGGRFRRDLYYRLNVFPIEIAPLRLRQSDIPLLARHFLGIASGRMKTRPEPLTEDHVRQLQEYDWPGNVRELQNVIERAVITSRGRDLTFPLSSTGNTVPLPSREDNVVSDEEMKRRETENTLAALRRANGRVYGDGGAAELLGIKPSTLASRIKKMGIERRR